MNTLLKILLGIVLSVVMTGTVWAEEEAVDGIVATVNGEPITLRDLSKRLSPPRQLTMQQAATDPEAKTALDQMIQERLVEEEAKLRRITVSDEEVNRYLDQLAERNEMSREDFEKALVAQRNQSVDSFKNEVKYQILQSKLAGELARGSAAVTDKEIDEYLKEHPDMKNKGGKIKLSQIVFSGTDIATRQKADDVRQQIVDDDIDFDEAAEKYSDSPEGKEGGSLGIVQESDLDPAVFDAIFSLHDGEVSQVVASPAGFHIFMLEERIKDDEDEEEQKVRSEVEQILKQQKLESRMKDYFNVDLFTNHFVDRKI